MSLTLNAQLLEKFLKLAARKLEGKWLLVGGTLLPAVGLDIRSTMDIDLLGLGKKEASQALELMELSDSLGLPVETVNQAAAFFLKKAGYEEKDLLPLLNGPKATIYRPSVHLYWKLKIGRLSETDVIDCQHYFHYCVGQRDTVSRGDLMALITKAAKNEPVAAKRERLQSLGKLCGKD